MTLARTRPGSCSPQGDCKRTASRPTLRRPARPIAIPQSSLDLAARPPHKRSSPPKYRNPQPPMSAADLPASKPRLDVQLCAPRGFCAGVVRAIDAVEQALLIYGPPVYVRHEIVHNKYVVEGLRRKGAVFVDELAEVPADRGARDLLGPWRAEVGAGGGGRAQAVRHRRDLPAGDQGSSRGRGPLPARPHGRSRRPCGPPRGRGHDGPVARWRRLPGGDDRRCRAALAARSREARLRDADDAVRRRHARDRRGAARALPGDRRAPQGRHLLRHDQPAGGGEGRCAAAWTR